MPLLTPHALPLTGGGHDLDPLLDLVGDRSLVLLGEASHGTHEFYAARARITRRLVEEKGFVAVAVEADWPDAHRVNRWVRGLDDGDALDALGGFRRFPTWMWRNTVVRDFLARHGETPLADLVSGHRITYEVEANWKVLAENYNECYHCGPVHPPLARLTPPTSGENDLVSGPVTGGFMVIDVFDWVQNGFVRIGNTPTTTSDTVLTATAPSATPGRST